ncbi:MAG: hypothetical protein LKF49_09110 [Bifidobacterium tibiigranuli]|jgi:hypothetical protein|uniref:hypothetical protein n=1 Tax=Bifidobacterium tibiigranuli TaxID=2172043 RepID=UPI002356BF78|nr:hypothetical protein [Bifidobacterium tibiigranuli]MCH3974604.1 hypothetical protein [Bifidobacterium tibiigranuli]MCH4189524.1 hypothetical protein [Bifidobacterium tibiigranuli]MCH4204346.1 hypothetical protein [Bifidobacterium tibiigranuli]MCH4275393.1 hypothetical protein [Bifidobacterium tibiigranuli]MCI1791598.1 hypothetical protein [Bifidobacterium tibiigranuli]
MKRNSLGRLLLGIVGGMAVAALLLVLEWKVASAQVSVISAGVQIVVIPVLCGVVAYRFGNHWEPKS